MRTYTPQKNKLADLIERLEAAVVRLESAIGPPVEAFQVDPAAQEAADRMVEQRKHELLGEDAPYE